jgi:hypothetical protein
MSEDGGGPNMAMQQALLNSQLSAANAGSQPGTTSAVIKTAKRFIGVDLEGDGDVANLSKFASSMSMQAAAPGGALNGESLLAKIVGELVQILNSPIEDQTGGVGGSPHGDGAAMPNSSGGSESGSYDGGGGGGGGGGDVQARVFTGAESMIQPVDITPPAGGFVSAVSGGGRGGSNRGGGDGGGGGMER